MERRKILKKGFYSHISEEFNVELEEIVTRVISMGETVGNQLANALKALCSADAELGREVVERDALINSLEVQIDEDCTEVMAIRQPAASDLRLLVTVTRIVSNLERIGDEAEKIASMAVRLGLESHVKQHCTEIAILGGHVRQMVGDSIAAFEALDPERAVQVAHADLEADQKYNGIVRLMAIFMAEDPRTITWAIDMLMVARALERIGDHARNICDSVVYLVKGKDVRHATLEEIERTIRNHNGS